MQLLCSLVSVASRGGVSLRNVPRYTQINFFPVDMRILLTSTNEQFFIAECIRTSSDVWVSSCLLFSKMHDASIVKKSECKHRRKKTRKRRKRRWNRTPPSRWTRSSASSPRSSRTSRRLRWHSSLLALPKMRN